MPTPIVTAIAFRTAPSAVGLMLVARALGHAGSARDARDARDAILAVLIGDDEHALRRELAGRFPHATVERDETTVGASLAAKVAAAVTAPAAAAELAIDPRGTSFQQRVWKELRLVAAGTTTTYSDLARRIGSPNAVRAVAGACAANPIAILIPCHRVVRRDGDLSGYRWGVERKRALLALEGARSA